MRGLLCLDGSDTRYQELRLVSFKTMRERKPKLLYVVTEDWYFHSHRLAHAVAAMNAGYEVSVATRVTDHEKVIREAGIGLIPVELARRGANPFREAKAIFQLIQIYREYRPDIVHHVALKPVLEGSLAAVICGVPVVVNAIAGLGYVYSSRTLAARCIRVMFNRVLPLICNRARSYVIVQNQDDGDVLLRLGVQSSKVVLIPGASVDLQAFKSGEEMAVPPVTVILASRMILDKGLKPFVAAAQEIMRRRAGVRFVLVGKPDTGNPNAVSEAQLREWSRSGAVEWWGHRDDMPTVLRESHIMCFPSFYGEGIPKILLEAAASGKPIVATDIPGCRDVVKHGENGYLVGVGNHDALVQALDELICDADKRKAMGIKGRALVASMFDLNDISRSLLNLYRAALGSGI